VAHGGLVTEFTLYVTSQCEFTFTVPNQCFGEVCWRNMHFQWRRSSGKAGVQWLSWGLWKLFKNKTFWNYVCFCYQQCWPQK